MYHNDDETIKIRNINSTPLLTLYELQVRSATSSLGPQNMYLLWAEIGGRFERFPCFNKQIAIIRE